MNPTVKRARELRSAFMVDVGLLEIKVMVDELCDLAERYEKALRQISKDRPCHSCIYDIPSLECTCLNFDPIQCAREALTGNKGELNGK